MTSQSIFPTDDTKHGQMALESLGTGFFFNFVKLFCIKKAMLHLPKGIMFQLKHLKQLILRISTFALFNLEWTRNPRLWQNISYLLSVGKVMGSMLGQNRVIAKNVKSCTYCCYVRCATLIVWVEYGNALAPNRCNSFFLLNKLISYPWKMGTKYMLIC